jgi:hypothetical protein
MHQSIAERRLPIADCSSALEDPGCKQIANRQWKMFSGV